jgi:hypothetical protein
MNKRQKPSAEFIETFENGVNDLLLLCHINNYGLFDYWLIGIRFKLQFNQLFGVRNPVDYNLGHLVLQCMHNCLLFFWIFLYNMLSLKTTLEFNREKAQEFHQIFEKIFDEIKDIND